MSRATAVAGVLSVLTFYIPYATSAQSPQSAGFVVLLGTDTVQIERFTKGPGRIEGVVAYRAPTARLVRYTLELDDEGHPWSYRQTLFKGDGVTKIEPNAANASMTFRFDSVTIETFKAADPFTLHIPAPTGTVPQVGGSPMIPFAYSYLTYELAFGEMMRSGVALGAGTWNTVATFATQKAAAPSRVWVMSPDSVEMDYFGVARIGFRFNERRELVRSDWRNTTYKYTVSRIVAPDVDAIARAWGEQEAAGKGFGRYSPRDSVNFNVSGASISLAYARPSKRGREIFGGVVPFGEVWRLGADMATQMTTDRDLVIEGVTIPAGAYSLWLLPRSATDVQLIVNKQTGQFGTQYNPKLDLVRIPMKAAVHGDNVIEKLTLGIRDGSLWIEWDRVSYYAGLQVPEPTPTFDSMHASVPSVAPSGSNVTSTVPSVTDNVPSGS